ncbi:hypothetical protein NECAME_08878 [Necator americanus]|uniref:Uncharacterized protein n=1 Tax=Necator americanus TaxID=51031 RepID=W2TH45_NECAM|nr:hypothetical protein NECAME_08878 [Necator americanus]ETN80914.1 hypothetical protein NECAME_08878 [Necator americanus]
MARRAYETVVSDAMSLSASQIKKPLTQEQMYGHRRGNVVGSNAKGETRTARSITTVAIFKE